MAYTQEVIKRARERLASEKADRESRYRQNLQQAYEQVPRIREIDILLRKTMAQAAQAAFTQGGDARTMMETIREENLSLQRERQALVEANFPAGFLDEGALCDKCGGSGYIGSTMCTCLKRLCGEEQKKELTLLSEVEECFDDFRLEYYPDQVDPKLGVNVRMVMERTYQACRRYAENFNEKSGNLLLSGDTGLGKTFLSACIARTVAENGHAVVYESAGHLFTCMERAKFSGDEQARRDSERYTACDLLIVDDLGTEMPGQFTTAALYALINDRMLAKRPTIISTNLNTEDLAKRYNPQIVSRLRGNFARLAFLGEDIRVKKGWGKL